ALPRLEEDDESEDAEDYAINEGGKDLHAIVAVGLLRGGRALGEPDGEKREPDSGRVHEEVGGVREEGEGVRPPSHHHLHHHEGRAEAEDGPQAVLVARGVGVAMMHGAQRGTGTVSRASPCLMPWLS